MNRHKYLWILVVVLLYIFPKNIYAYNPITFENLTIDDGLSQATVETIIQDSKGYIWIGTNDGLNRYNGTDMRVFKSDKKNKDSIISSYILSLAEDNSGNLWVGTDEGISRIDLTDYSIKNYRYYKNNKNTPYSAINTIYVDDNNLIYIGTNNGVYIYDEDKDEFNKILDSKVNIYSIAKDKNKDIWVGTQRGINKIDAKTNKVDLEGTEYIDSLDWGIVYSLLFDNDNNLWIATSEKGLKKINFETKEVKSYYMDENDKYSLKSNSIRDLIQDDKGIIWIATEKGLSKYLGNDKFASYLGKSYDSNSLAHNIVYSLMKDNTGLIWAGTYTGVSIFDPDHKIETYRNDPFDENTLSDNVVMGVYEDEDGLLWIGTRDKGLNIIDRKRDHISHIYEGDSSKDLSTNAVSIITGKENIIWVGTRNGVNKINKDNMNIEKYTTEDGLIDNNIKSLLVDSKNRLWIGTPKGVTILDIETGKVSDITEKLIEAGIEEPYIQEIYEDKDGIFWMGGYISGGLIRYDEINNSIIMYNSYREDGDGEELVVNTIRDILEDNRGNLWIGTNSGLLYFDKKSTNFKVYTDEDGLANNIVYGILADNDKNLWISTNNGISKFDIKEEKFTNLSSKDGLQSNEFNGNSSYKCNDGEFLFGGINGLNIFNPDNILLKTNSSDVVFDDFEVEGKTLEDIDGKTFPYDENFIRIRYFVPDYRNNGNIQYYYKLSGLSNDWISVKSNEVILSDLKPGKYTFSIKFRGSNGVIGGENRVSFTIKPPYWKSPLAIVIYAIIIMILIYRNMNKVKNLDKLVYKRTKQLYDEMEKNQFLFDKVIEAERSKNNYFINLSHELRTPLNVINSIEQLIRSFCNSEKELSKEKLSSYMDMMRSNTDRLLNLINNIIDTSKIENGKYKLNLDYHNIVYIAEEASLSLKESIESLGIELIFDTDVEEKIILCDKYDIERCIINLVSNAQKFTPSGGRITVKINDLDEFVEITVEDTGIGIEKKYHSTIFDRFNQVVDEHSEVKGGSGLGLTITKHIIDLHKGEIFIESEKHKGTKFIIILPVK